MSSRLYYLIVCFLGAGTLLAVDLNLLPVEEHFIFANTPATISIPIQNTGSTPAAIQHRFYQASSATLAPVTGLLDLEPTLPPAQTTLIPLKIQPPEVRTISRFVLKLYHDQQEFGAIPIRVCPTNLLGGLKSIAPRIALLEPEDLFSSLLKQNSLPATPITPDSASTSPADLAIVRLTSKEQLASWLELSPSLPATLPIIYILSPGLPSAEKLLPVKFTRKPRPAAIVQDWFLPDLQTSPLSQLRLLHTIELLLKPELVKSPESAK